MTEAWNNKTENHFDKEDINEPVLHSLSLWPWLSAMADLAWCWCAMRLRLFTEFFWISQSLWESSCTSGWWAFTSTSLILKLYSSVGRWEGRNTCFWATGGYKILCKCSLTSKLRNNEGCPLNRYEFLWEHKTRWIAIVGDFSHVYSHISNHPASGSLVALEGTASSTGFASQTLDCKKIVWWWWWW